MAEFMHSDSSTRSQTSAADPWLALAKRLRGRVNLAWWLQSWLSWWMGIILLGAVMLLLQRLGLIQLPTSVILYGVLGLIALAALHSWLSVREHWMNQQAALQHLESKKQLNNALSTASAGIGPWPRYGRQQDAVPLAWQWKRILPLFLAPLLLLAVSLLLPKRAQGAGADAQSRPAAWEQIESVLLDQNLQQLADPARLEAMREEMKRLGSRPPGEWFDHDSLETGDRVASLLNSGLEQTERNLAEAAKVMQRLNEDGSESQGQPLSDTQLEELARQLEQNLQNLQNQPLGLSEEMRQRLMQVEPQALQGMNAQQAQQMMEELRQWSEEAGKLGEQMGQAGGEKPLWQQLLEDGEQGGGGGEEGPGGPGGQGDPEGQGGMGPNGQNRPGQGGTSRGKGDAPLTLKPDESLLNPDLQAGLQGDAEGMQPGERLGESLSTADVERTEMGVRAGGTAEQEGSGGDRVWRQQLTPSEQNLLENYFE